MPDEPQESPWKSWWFKLFLVLSLMLLLLVLALFIYDKTGQAQLDRAISQARQDGPPVTFEELQEARKDWPDEENGALVIVGIEQTLTDLSKDPRMEKLPFVGYSKKPDPILGERWPDEIDKAATTQLERLAPELGQIDRLLGYQGGRFPLQLMENPIDTLLPHLALIRPAAKLKAFQTVHRVMHGDSEYLLDDITVMLRHGQLLADEPTLISSLVRVACDALTVATIEEACAQAVLPSALLLQLEQTLATLENADYLSWGIRGERAFFMGAADYFRGGGDLGSGITLPIPPRIPGLRGYLLHDEAVGLRMFNRLVRAASDPGEGLKVANQLDDERDSWSGPGSLMTSVLMPSLSRAFELTIRLTAQVRCARAALAAERYRIDHGSFPQQLEQLVPAYLDEIPEDPFDLRPLRYCADEDHVVVYSVGEDMKDHGGKVDHFRRKEDPRDCGFALLAPDMRGRQRSGKPLYDADVPDTLPHSDTAPSQ